MNYIHTKCGGLINVSHRQCTKCLKKWNIISFWLNSNQIRPVPEVKGLEGKQYVRPVRSKAKKAKYVDWIERNSPGAYKIASKLPNWPRWARLTFTVLIIAVVVALVIMLTSCATSNVATEAPRYSIETISEGLLVLTVGAIYHKGSPQYHLVLGLKEIAENYTIISIPSTITERES